MDKRACLPLMALMAGLLALSGCYSYPPLPEPVKGSAYSEPAPEEHRTLPPDCTVLTLAMAREVALANNPDFRSARHAMAAANARFYHSLTEHLPRVTGGYDFTETRYNPESRGGMGDVRNFSTKTTFMRSEWLVFNGLAQTMETLASRHDARQAEANERDARRLLSEAVGLAYNQVLLAREAIRIAQADADFNNKLLAETELKYEAGAVALSEVLNFRIRVNDAMFSMAGAEYAFASSRAILAELLGLTVGTLAAEVFPPLADENVEAGPQIDVEVHLDTALANRPDLAAYREALRAAKYRLYARYGAFSPTLTLFTDFGWARTDPGYHGRWHMRNRTQDRFFSYGAVAQWDVLQSGGRWFDLREAQAIVAGSQESVTAQWIAVVAEVRQAYDNLARQRVQQAIAAETLELVRQTRDLVEEEYKAGNTSLTRLNEAQRDFIFADTSLVRTRLNMINARINLEAVTAADPTENPAVDAAMPADPAAATEPDAPMGPIADQP